MASGMNSRVHPKYNTKYRVTNWSEYDRALVQRGDITLWISPEAIKGWNAKPSGRRGAPQKHTDLAIETALTLPSCPNTRPRRTGRNHGHLSASRMCACRLISTRSGFSCSRYRAS